MQEGKPPDARPVDDEEPAHSRTNKRLRAGSSSSPGRALRQKLDGEDIEGSEAPNIDSNRSLDHYKGLITDVDSERVAHTGTTAPPSRDLADPLPERKRLAETHLDPGTINESLPKLRDLSQQAHELGARQQTHIVAIERLQARLQTNERTYGELLRESIELRRSIEKRRELIKTDRQELETERAALKDTGDKLYRTIASLQDLLGSDKPAAIKREND